MRWQFELKDYWLLLLLLAKTINTRLPVSNPIMWQFEKGNVTPKLSFHYSTAKQFHKGLDDF
jgi:hypothetical protein